MEAILGLLRAGGGRITTSRRSVVGALLGLEGHITVEDLCDLVQESAPEVVVSTIYRNLEELERPPQFVGLPAMNRPSPTCTGKADRR